MQFRMKNIYSCCSMEELPYFNVYNMTFYNTLFHPDKARCFVCKFFSNSIRDSPGVTWSVFSTKTESQVNDMRITFIMISTVILKVNPHKSRRRDGMPVIVQRKCASDLWLIFSPDSVTCVVLLPAFQLVKILSYSSCLAWTFWYLELSSY